MRLVGLDQKVRWQESCPNDRGPWPLPTRTNCRCLRSRTPKAERGKPLLARPVDPPEGDESPIFPPRPLSFSAKARIAPTCQSRQPRQADRKESPRSCGKGCWKKRMPFCNEADTSSEFARREGELTSSRCLFARALGEPKSRRNGDG